MPHDKEIDTRGLNCPLPILRTKKALSDCGRNLGWCSILGNAHSGKISNGGSVNVVPRKPRIDTSRTQTKSVTR